MSKTVAIIQARTSSSRLPGKVHEPILGRALLLHVVDRVRAATTPDEIVLATSTDAADDAVEKVCRDDGVACFRGSLDDVLSRFMGAAEKYGATAVIRITADCPFLDPHVVDEIVTVFQKEKPDYCSNVTNPTYPDGLDTEVFTMDALRRADREAKLPSEREHVTPYINKHPELFKLRSVERSPSLAGLRWTVDEPRDLTFVRAVADTLGRFPKDMQELLLFLEKHPDIAALNTGILRNSGYKA